jgi:hypothetical protein
MLPPACHKSISIVSVVIKDFNLKKNAPREIAIAQQIHCC